MNQRNYGSHLFGNIVITGGVSSIIGIEKIVSQIFNKQAKIGYPQKVVDSNNDLSNPSFTTAIGMLVYLQNIHKTEQNKEGFRMKEGLLHRFVNYLTSI